jgi:hypothetical protein
VHLLLTCHSQSECTDASLEPSPVLLLEGSLLEHPLLVRELEGEQEHSSSPPEEPAEELDLSRLSRDLWKMQKVVEVVGSAWQGFRPAASPLAEEPEPVEHFSQDRSPNQ